MPENGYFLRSSLKTLMELTPIPLMVSRFSAISILFQFIRSVFISCTEKLLNLLEPIVYAIRTYECGQRSKIESCLAHLCDTKTPPVPARPFIGFDLLLFMLDRGELEDI